MVEPLPRRAKTFAAAVILALVVLGACVALDDGLGDPSPADWRVVPGTELDPESTAVPIEVRERECASGRDADGRIVADVVYGVDTIAIDIGVRRRGGDQECPSNPVTSFVVELDQPLGSRTITGERWPDP